MNAKRTWSEQAEEVDYGQNNQNEMKQNSRANSNSRKKSKPNDFKQSKPKKAVELETDPAVLQRRQKQIDYGKNTVGYANYTQSIPPDQRTKEHPKTPDKYSKYSRRAWDMLIKIWRKDLHKFDSDVINTNDNEVGNDNAGNTDGDAVDGDVGEGGDNAVGDVGGVGDNADGGDAGEGGDNDSPSENSLNISLNFLDD